MRHAPRYLALLAIAAVMVGPFVWLLLISLRGQGNIFALSLDLRDYTLANYGRAWTGSHLAGNFLNSVGAALTAVVLSVLLAGLAAYPLARHRFPGRGLIFLAILSTLMVPFQVYMIPLYLLCRTLGLTDAPFDLPTAMNALEPGAQRLRSWFAVALPFSVSAFGVYLLRQHFAGVPRSLEEAARMDGAGEFTIWWRVFMPLAKPAIATLAIFTFVAQWSNFLWPLLILNRDEMYTLPVRIAKAQGVFGDSTNVLAAASVIAIAPVILFFLVLQRWFIRGIGAGALKG
jgi:putative chitobiose transport system permease protein